MRNAEEGTQSNVILAPSAPALFLAKWQKFFLENLLLARFLCWRDVSRELYFREDFELFFHIGVKKHSKSSHK